MPVRFRPVDTVRSTGLVVALLAMSALPAVVLPAVVLPAAPAAAAASAGLSCSEIGSYRDPAGIVAPSVGADGSSSPGSPRYRLTATGTSPSVSLVVRRVSDNKVLLNLNTAATNWGFSPDQDRFVTYRTNSGMLEAQVYNLAASKPAAAVLQHAVSTTNARLGFSPGGTYAALTYAWSGSPTTITTLISDAVTGKQAFESTYTYSAAAAGGKPFGAAGWGFSPDDGEFLQAWVAGQSAVQFDLVNLATRRTVFSPMLTGSGYWKFSPCGGILALVEQHSASMMEISLIRSGNGATAGSWSGAVATVTFRATKESHIATIGGTDHVLAPNN